jgi:hypothetical protein
MLYEFINYTLKPGHATSFAQQLRKTSEKPSAEKTTCAILRTVAGRLDQVTEIRRYEDFNKWDHSFQERGSSSLSAEVDYESLSSVESELFYGAQFSSPFSTLNSQMAFYEVRAYQFRSGSAKAVIDLWQPACVERDKLSPLYCFYTGLTQESLGGVGPLHKWVHIYPYSSMQERDEIRKSSWNLKNWPPKHSEFILSMETQITLAVN